MEQQELILCKCGCGLNREKYDKYRREAKYIKGHYNNLRIFSEKTRQKISLSKLGKKNPKISETKKRLFTEGKIISSMLGKKHSEESKKKMSETKKRLFKEGKIIPSHLGKKFSEETRKKISLSKKGGKHTEEWKIIHSLKMMGENNPLYNKHLSEESKKKMSLSKLGKKLSEETKKKMSLNRKGMKFSNEHKNRLSLSLKGRIITEEMKKNLSEKAKKRFLDIRNHPFYGRKHTEKTKNKIRESRAKQIFPIKDSSIELKIQDYLKQLGIEFFTHQYLKDIKHSYQCDILIPSKNIVIECDGDYWHNYPIGRNIDNIRTKELLEKGFKVLRLWETDIKIMKINEFKNKIIEVKNDNYID